ncbi:MAG: dehydratase [Anaerolineales bacterium]|nr:MAG: dehydratase [Anaerolineales bacterium]
MSVDHQVKGLYFEQFEVGEKVTSPGRTITEADLIIFAGTSGDFNSIHTDAVYAASTPFGARVAHGVLGLAIASGLAVRTGVMEGTIMAFREILEWKFSQPIFIGDTIHITLEAIEKNPLPRLGGGAITLSIDVRNQEDASVMRGKWVVLVKSQPDP